MGAKWSFIFLIITLQSHASAVELGLSSDGVGPINKNSLFNKAKIQGQLPKWEIKEVGVLGAGGHPYNLLAVFDGKTKVLEILPDEGNKAVLKVIVLSNKIKNSFGPQIGSLFGSVFKEPPKACEPYFEDDETDSTVCAAPQSKYVRYIFGGKWGRDIPYEVLRSYKLTSIFWFAP